MSPRRIFISFGTMMRKEFVRMFRIWSQTFLPPVITSTLYFLVFGTFIGSQLAPIQGISYMQFIIPGLIMMTVITSSYTNVVSMFFMAKFMRTIDEILVSPTPDWVVILGFVSGGILRGLITGVLVLIVALFFAPIAIANVFVIIAAFMLTSVVFSLAGLINGVYAKGFDGISIIPTFVLTPLTYLGGIFYSITLFPEFWQNVSLLNPILYMINAFRYGFWGISDIPLWQCFAVLIGITALFILASMWLFRSGIGMKN
ncbi:MAG TPA: ABC transporter permease [Candidatus Paceibacterota bacterium]|nr:ABC transporter permease [Candidatus Paceibacterota bacterium]